MKVEKAVTPRDFCTRTLAMLAASLWQVLVLAGFVYLPFAGSPAASNVSARNTISSDSSARVITVSIAAPSVELAPSALRSGPTSTRASTRPGLTPILMTPIPIPDDLDHDNAIAPVVVSPETLTGTADIYCEVHIHQGPNGRVQAIDFGRCTGDALWQRSLIGVIQQAAALVQAQVSRSDPRVQTLTLETNSISASALAEELTERR